MELAAAKMIGAGIACIALVGAGIGIGNVFGSYLSGALRNPGAAASQTTTNRKANVTTSQNIWLGNVDVSNGGKPPDPSWEAGCSVVAFMEPASIIRRLREQDDERDHQTEQAGRFAQREAEEQVRGLSGGGTRIAQRAREVAAEHVADADTGADESDTGKAGTDHFCCCEIHVFKSFWSKDQ